MKQFVNELKVNDRVDSVFMLRKKSLKLTKYDKPYLDLAFSDKTGTVQGRLWDDAERFNTRVEAGHIVTVRGTVDAYRQEKQIKVESIDKADDRSYVYEDLVRVVQNRQELMDNMRSYLEGLSDKWLKQLGRAFLEDKDLMQRFIDGVGAKSWHNAYIGGLLEHTYEVMYMVGQMCGLCPDANRDIALFGAFIHDIGKVSELDPRHLEYTVEGGLVGHIAIGHKILMEKINGISGFPGDLAMMLEHIILSHHGEYEQQSPVLPKTLEATIVYHTDDLVSQTNAVKEIKNSGFPEGTIWSPFVNIKNRKYFVRDTKAGPPAAKENEDSDNDLFG